MTTTTTAELAEQTKQQQKRHRGRPPKEQTYESIVKTAKEQLKRNLETYTKAGDTYNKRKSQIINEAADKLAKTGGVKLELISAVLYGALKELVTAKYIQDCLPPEYKQSSKARDTGGNIKTLRRNSSPKPDHQGSDEDAEDDEEDNGNTEDDQDEEEAPKPETETTTQTDQSDKWVMNIKPVEYDIKDLEHYEEGFMIDIIKWQHKRILDLEKENAELQRRVEKT